MVYAHFINKNSNTPLIWCIVLLFTHHKTPKRKVIAMPNTIQHLCLYIQYLERTIVSLVAFIAKYIPLAQLSFDELNSPAYQKFKTDKLPIIKKFEPWDWRLLQEYYVWKYGSPVKPIRRRGNNSIPEDTVCFRCNAPHHYIYDNTGGRGSYLCKVCGTVFASGVKVTRALTHARLPILQSRLVAEERQKAFYRS